MQTINQTEVPGIISSEIPEVRIEVSKLSSGENIAGVLQIVVNFIREMLQKHNMAKAQWCIMLVGWIHGRGSTSVRDIIENLFVRSFDGMKRLCAPSEWLVLQSKMSSNLYAVYIRQNGNAGR